MLYNRAALLHAAWERRHGVADYNVLLAPYLTDLDGKTRHNPPAARLVSQLLVKRGSQHAGEWWRSRGGDSRLRPGLAARRTQFRSLSPP